MKKKSYLVVKWWEQILVSVALALHKNFGLDGLLLNHTQGN